MTAKCDRCYPGIGPVMTLNGTRYCKKCYAKITAGAVTACPFVPDEDVSPKPTMGNEMTVPPNQTTKKEENSNSGDGVFPVPIDNHAGGRMREEIVATFSGADGMDAVRRWMDGHGTELRRLNYEVVRIVGYKTVRGIDVGFIDLPVTPRRGSRE